MTQPSYSLADLNRIMQRLRDPNDGCPWDLRQDFATLVPSTLEECYELAQAIEDGNHEHIAEELGDVLFQVIFYTQLGSEKGLFTFEEVVSTLAGKLLRRHPHVFASAEIEGRVATNASVEEVNESWEALKQQERSSRAQHGILDDVPRALPALPRAQKVQKRVAAVNFDWPDYSGSRLKIQEELAELDEAVASGDSHEIEEEMGDLLFSCVNAARHLGLDAEASLRRATAKFENRFQTMITLAESSGSELGELSDLELDSLWREAKLTS